MNTTTQPGDTGDKLAIAGLLLYGIFCWTPLWLARKARELVR